MFNIFNKETDRINKIINEGARSRLTDLEFVEKEIESFKSSKVRRLMIEGQKYFIGDHTILNRKRMVTGENDKQMEVKNLPNNKTVDNQYRKMIKQKVNYLLGQPIIFQTENKEYENLLKKQFDKSFARLISNIGKDSMNCGIGWIYPHYDDDGKIIFKRLPPHEVIPGWNDIEHTTLDYLIRFYEVIAFEGDKEKTIEKVEVYDTTGICFFEKKDCKLIPCKPYHQDYYTRTDGEGIEQGFNWSKIPLIPFKFNSEETPLILNVKCLQDGLNLVISNFQNNMEEDARSTILVITNYDGEDLGGFRKNLATYGVIKVRSDDSNRGGVSTLQVEVNAENYKTILDLLKKAIIENAMGYDAKDDRLGGNANQLNIRSMYSDIDLDANEMETEFQASFETLIQLINDYLYNDGQGDFSNEEVRVIFNRDMLINESEAIENVMKSVGFLSDESLITRHPFVENPIKELERLKKQKEEQQKELDYQQEAFNPVLTRGNGRSQGSQGNE